MTNLIGLLLAAILIPFVVAIALLVFFVGLLLIPVLIIGELLEMFCTDMGE